MSNQVTQEDDRPLCQQMREHLIEHEGLSEEVATRYVNSLMPFVLRFVQKESGAEVEA